MISTLPASRIQLGGIDVSVVSYGSMYVARRGRRRRVGFHGREEPEADGGEMWEVGLEEGAVVVLVEGGRRAELTGPRDR